MSIDAVLEQRRVREAAYELCREERKAAEERYSKHFQSLYSQFFDAVRLTKVTALREAGREKEADRLDDALDAKWMKVLHADKEWARLKREEKKAVSAGKAALRELEGDDEDDE